MKKTTIILAGLALIAASCAKTEVVSSGPEGGEKGISFSAYTARPTKAQDVTTGNLESFKATAIGNSAVYFDGVKFTKSSTTPAVWESTPAYFWPAYALDFYAYNTPADGHGTITPDINTISQIIKVEPSTTVANQEDLVAAYVHASDPGNGGATAISFHHYLTQVVLKAQCSNSNYTVKVYGIKLANLAGEGTYTFSTSAETAGNMVATTGKVNSDESVDYSADITEVSLSSTLSDELGRWYLIPQTVKPWDRDNNMTNTEVSSSSITGTYDYGTYLALKVLITSKGGANIYPYSGTTSAWMAVPVPTDLAFAQGKKYNVTVDFFSRDTNGAGYVDPEVPGELDGNPGTDDNGKAILGGAIKFNATVDSWGNDVNITISL